MQAFFVSIGMPKTLQEAGGKVEDIAKLASSIVNGQTGKFVHLLPPQVEEILKIAAGV